MKILTWLLLSFTTVTMTAADLGTVPSDTLVAWAAHRIAAGQRNDTTMIYLSMVARRYYANPLDTKSHPAVIEAMRHLGNLYMTTYSDYGKAYEYLSLGIQLAEEDNLPQQLPLLYASMANLWNTNNLVRSKSNDKTREYIKQAFATAVRTRNNNALPVIAINMAILDHSGNMFNKELSAFNDMSIPATTPLLEFAHLYVAGVKASKNGDHTKAERLFHLAIDKAPQGYYAERYTISAAVREAEEREAAGDPAGARDLLLRYLNLANAKGSIDFVLTIYGALAFNYDRVGMNDSASAYEYKWLLEREKLRQQNLPDMNETALVDQIGQVNTELKQMSIKRQQRERQLIVACCAGLMALVVALAVALAWRAQRRKARELFKQNQRLLRSPKPQAPNPVSVPKVKYENSGMGAELSAMLYQELLHIIATSPQIYEPGFSLEQLADLSGAKSRLVSQAINENSGSTFCQLLADYRIREACRRLVNPAYANHTVEGIAKGVGIMSRTTFTITFKRVTGLTPAQYRREAASNAQ